MRGAAVLERVYGGSYPGVLMDQTQAMRKQEASSLLGDRGRRRGGEKGRCFWVLLKFGGDTQ